MNYRPWLFAQGPDAFSLNNPASPKMGVATRLGSSPSDIEDASGASNSALRGWRKSTVADRSAVLRKAGDILLREETRFAEAITAETGKHVRDSFAEVRNAAGVLHYYAGRIWNPHGVVLPSVRAGVSLRTVREPVGVIAIISPWNFPVNLLAVKLAPALAMGNAIVAKPSTIGSGASLMLIDALYEAGLPENVVTVVLGSGAVVGNSLVTADGISAVSFTGSTTVGKSVAIAATEIGRRYLCEMGGKNASVVLDDADIDLAIEALIPAAFSASGQKCTATSRIIVQRSIVSEFSERFLDRVSKIRFGDPYDDDAYSGPVVSRGQFDSIVGIVDAESKSGSALTSDWAIPAEPDQDGYFVPPTVFSGVEATDRLFQEEVFGPVVSISEADDVRQAIELVNASNYGLSASVFTQSLDSAALFESEVECGVINVNLPTSGLEFQTPYAGWKESGTSYQEQGDEAFAFYSKGKSVAVRSIA